MLEYLLCARHCTRYKVMSMTVCSHRCYYPAVETYGTKRTVLTAKKQWRKHQVILRLQKWEIHTCLESGGKSMAEEKSLGKEPSRAKSISGELGSLEMWLNYRCRLYLKLQLLPITISLPFS